MINNSSKIKVFVVDDDNLSIDLLVQPFQESGFIDFVGRANSGEECLEKLRNKPVDIILMDIIMSGIDGIETARHLLKHSEPVPKIIFLSVFNDFEYIQKAFELKASMLGKFIGIDYLLSTIRRVQRGELVFNPNPNGIIKEDSNAKLKFVIKQLLREDQIEIACLIRNGKTADEIAALLNKSAVYINNQKREIKRKLKDLNPDPDSSINAAFLGAIMERSGLCGDLEIADLDLFQLSANSPKK